MQCVCVEYGSSVAGNPLSGSNRRGDMQETHEREMRRAEAAAARQQEDDHNKANRFVQTLVPRVSELLWGHEEEDKREEGGISLRRRAVILLLS